MIANWRTPQLPDRLGSGDRDTPTTAGSCSRAHAGRTIDEVTKNVFASSPLPRLPSDGDDSADVREPVLMSLNPIYYELIWAGAKRHEFRRRFLAGQPARWYVYLTAPVARLGAVIDLGPAVVDTPQRIADIAEQARAGNGAPVLEYVKDLPQAFAIPIQRVAQYPGIPLDQLKAELGSFHPPQGYTKLRNHPDLLSICEKVTARPPTREMTVHSH
ncbi:hypothetical protein [Micromonospora auratinigra]|uniref:Predicted transcriptional regulator, contains an HTH and PUA-like domains n=1 Tax=Micromonospora auratinigra TaxID=261654 RepID=A0A1A8Z9D3_9ACTN|nr:hypothetical protein [Micromonospora auratinigra]SBT40571.1 Predicted transcriptional regulator, contains an HTH and PUA-like domains [Micromonospora auratinigra]